MTEGNKHFRAKLKAKEILNLIGCQTVTDEEEKIGVTFEQRKNWKIDAYGELTIKIGIEIDGKVGHGTKITTAKDKFRDKDNLERNQLYTVRFSPDDILDMPTHFIQAEILYRLTKQGLRLLNYYNDISTG